MGIQCGGVLMTGTAFDRIVAALEQHGRRVRRRGGAEAVAQCPAHDDHNPSLSITGTEGQVLIHCHTGCGTPDVVAALGLNMRDLYDTRRGVEYRYDNGRVVHRGIDKSFRQSNTDRPVELYRLGKVCAAVAAGETVYVVEGEKDVHALEAIGATATCNPMGAGKWGQLDPSPLYGARVRVIADQDEPGRAHAADVYTSLVGHADVEIMAPKIGKDPADHIAAGHGLEDFVAMPDSGADADAAGPAAPDRPSWAPIDLSAILAGTYTPPTPTLFERADGVCLLYPALVHSFHGESESGKSLLAQIQCVLLIMAGCDVLFLDFESDEVSVVGRLLDFGASAEAILAHFHYVRPEVDPAVDPRERAEWETLLARRYDLVVIDGVTDALGIYRHASKDNDGAAAWMRALPKRLADKTGAAVILVDHVVKDGEARGRFAIGAQAKMSGLTGAAYTVEVREPLGRGMRGVVVLRIGKDRPGAIRPHCGPFRKSDRTQEAARVIIDATGPASPVVTFEPPQTAGDGAADKPRTFRPTTLMERVSDVLAAAPDPLSQNAIVKRVGANEKNVCTAIDVLVAEGYVTRADGPNRSHLHSITRPYRQAADPQSDRYDGAASASGGTSGAFGGASAARSYTGTRAAPLSAATGGTSAAPGGTGHPNPKGSPS